MGRVETELLTSNRNFRALTDLSGMWIDQVHARTGLKELILDMDSSESPPHGEQEDSAWNGYFKRRCYYPLFYFNQYGDLERALLMP